MKENFIVEVKIENEVFHLYRITIHGQTILVASPTLADRIDELMAANCYFEDIAEMDGKTYTVQDIDDLFYYVFGDEDNKNPTEEEIIESIEDVWEE